MSFNLRVFLRLTRAWLLGITRDRATIFWMLAFPVLFVVIFGLAFGDDDVGSYRVGVVVDESTPTGRALLDGLRAVGPFKITTGSLDEELKKLRDGDRDAVVTGGRPDVTSTLVPAPAPSPGVSAVQGPTPRIQPTSTIVVQYDPARQTARQIVLPIVRQVVDRVDQELSGRAPILVVEERSVRTDTLRYIDYFVPGIIGFSIMQAGMFAAIPLVQLRVTRMLKRFGATPISPWLVLASQGATRLVLALVTTAVLLLVGRLLFGINLGNNWPGLAAFLLLGGAAFLGLGFTVSGLARTEEAVPVLVQLVSFPMMLLAGVFFPIENFPGPMQIVAHALPLTFLGDGLRQVMTGGAGLYPLWVDYLVLLAWALIAGLLALRFFRWE